ncbi:DUF2294 domain-containing protein [Calothrix sp. UHCC 0171]|uniref:DUF2294 domain-containing protein n=1 Tax=Calothrix sp. UHCC 0171 TaxID=3110245 RepID=UPI002B2045E4|nr:DUF2294 domain-containing protein [Calothrix sp. UHCC 0171]MEA5570774.1 DUF2294 domain-containing protein [Calothrix sp. UHCC 0171]
MEQPTIGQLEREISNRIRSLYNAQLGQRIGKIICHFFDKQLAITIEDSVTLAEQTLLNSGKEHLAEQVRCDLDQIIKPQIKNTIEEVINKPIVELISHTSLASGRTAMIVVLEQPPVVRNPHAIPKAN